jgi:predicted 3-demethylubiquinone-9 3-methyltransferase (glyoxalase superfamily)
MASLSTSPKESVPSNIEGLPGTAQKITPFLWFDNQAEEAANLYTSIFKNSKMGTISRYGDAGPGPKGTAMTVDFQLGGQEFVALNGGPRFKFTEAISFIINCETQEEVDYFWETLSEGGERSQCGWLKDRFGLSWQVVPIILTKLLLDKDPEKAARVMNAMLQMTKIDIAKLQQAYAGG